MQVTFETIKTSEQLKIHLWGLSDFEYWKKFIILECLIFLAGGRVFRETFHFIPEIITPQGFREMSHGSLLGYIFLVSKKS